MHSPDTRAKMSATQKRIRADPEMRAQMSATAKRAWSTPEAKAKRAVTTKRVWAQRFPELAALTAEQLAVYRLLRRKRCSRESALAEARRI